MQPFIVVFNELIILPLSTGAGKTLDLSCSLSVCLSAAPLTDKPPKILSPSESQMSIIEMAIGK